MPAAVRSMRWRGFMTVTISTPCGGCRSTRTASPETRARYNLGTMECPLFDGLWDRARATVGGAIRGR